jgi:hypothetical protein
LTTQEISNLKSLIKDVRYKLNEIERAIERTQKEKNNFRTNKITPASRKRDPYRQPEK